MKPKHNPKRADPPRDSYKTKQFTKDWARLLSSGRYDLARAKEVMLLLISSETLGPEEQDHALNGEYADYRECHVGGDFLGPAAGAVPATAEYDSSIQRPWH